MTATQLKALAVLFARRSDANKNLAADYTRSRKLRDAARYFGRANAYQDAAMIVQDLANGFSIKGVTDAQAETLPKLTARGELIP